MRDWEDFVRFYRFPQEHWIHLRTSNPIESIFSGVRLADLKRPSGCGSARQSAVPGVQKIVERLSRNWRTLNGGATVMTLLLEGCVFQDGVPVQPRPAPAATAAAPERPDYRTDRKGFSQSSLTLPHTPLAVSRAPCTRR